MKILLCEAHNWIPGRASRSKCYTEKKTLLDMLSAEQEKTRLLMIPDNRKRVGWYWRLIGGVQ